MNKAAVEAGAEEPAGVWFDLYPVTGELDAEYQKQRGQDEHTVSVRRRENRASDDEPEIEIEPISKTFSNARELAAMSWLARKIINGWRPIALDDGNKLDFSERNLDKMSKVPLFVRPAIEEDYELVAIKTVGEEGNSETSSAGSSSQD
jgi:hypothetical protein